VYGVGRKKEENIKPILGRSSAKYCLHKELRQRKNEIERRKENDDFKRRKN
jgi:hypothetical protein